MPAPSRLPGPRSRESGVRIQFTWHNRAVARSMRRPIRTSLSRVAPPKCSHCPARRGESSRSPPHPSRSSPPAPSSGRLSAAFTSSTRNAGNAWSTGQVALTDDDLGSAGFTVTNLIPWPDRRALPRRAVRRERPGRGARLHAEPHHVEPGARRAHQVQGGEGHRRHVRRLLGLHSGRIGHPRAAAVRARHRQRRDGPDPGGPAPTTVGTPGETKVYRGSWTFDTTGMLQQQIDSLQNAQPSVDLVWEVLQSADPAK